MGKYLFVFLIFVFIGCTNDDESNYVTIKGRVEREINGEGISGQKVLLTMLKFHNHGSWSYASEIDYKEVITDSDGNFRVSMKKDSNTFVRVYKEQDDNYSVFNLSEFGVNENIVIKVNKFIKFKIFVNNTNPFDDNDYININFFSGNQQSFMTRIENFGLLNYQVPQENLPGGAIGPYEYASWTGVNVNSVVYYNVPENAEHFKVTWTKRKNGTVSSGFTNDISYSISQINEYFFEY